MDMVLPDPEAASEPPGRAVAPVSDAQEAELIVWVALTAPDEPVQVVESAPLKFMLAVVAPDPTVLITSRTALLVPAVMRFGLI